MKTKLSERPEKTAKSGCCGCDCGEAPSNAETGERQLERPEPTPVEGEEKSCCGG